MAATRAAPCYQLTGRQGKAGLQEGGREVGRHVGRPQIAGERLLSTCVTDFSCHQNSLTLRMTKVKEKEREYKRERGSKREQE